MRYTVNDDSLEVWFVILLTLRRDNPGPELSSLDYVISELEGEMLAHYTQDKIDKLFKDPVLK